MRVAEVVVLGALVALPACPGTEAVGGVRPGEPVPPYAAPTLAGDTVTLASLRGDPVLLNVWATWCVPCRVEMPELQSVAHAFAPQGLRVVGVSIDQAGAAPEVRRFAEHYGIRFTLLHDSRSSVTRVFRTVGVPETFLIDGDGVLRARWVGRVSAGDVETAVRDLLSAS